VKDIDLAGLELYLKAEIKKLPTEGEKMKPYELIIIDDTGRHVIKAKAIIAFQEMENGQVASRMFDNPDLTDDWWREIITGMYEKLEIGIKQRHERYQS
jgi:hypothetical protein